MFGRKNIRTPYIPFKTPVFFNGAALHERNNGQWEGLRNDNYQFYQPLTQPLYGNQYRIPFLNQNFPFPFTNHQWNSGHLGGINPFFQNMNGFQPFPFSTGGNTNQSYNSTENNKSIMDSIFQNPLQPPEESLNSGGNSFAGNPFPFMHPYPKQAFIHRPPSGLQSIMNSFKTQEGSFDFNKVVDTAGQMMNAVNQVSSMVKGLGGFFKA